MYPTVGIQALKDSNAKYVQLTLKNIMWFPGFIHTH